MTDFPADLPDVAALLLSSPLLFLDWEDPLDPDWARRFGIRL
jgi:hypothetical protein